MQTLDSLLLHHLVHIDTLTAHTRSSSAQLVLRCVPDILPVKRRWSAAWLMPPRVRLPPRVLSELFSRTPLSFAVIISMISRHECDSSSLFFSARKISRHSVWLGLCDSKHTNKRHLSDSVHHTTDTKTPAKAYRCRRRRSYWRCWFLLSGKGGGGGCSGLVRDLVNWRLSKVERKGEGRAKPRRARAKRSWKNPSKRLFGKR